MSFEVNFVAVFVATVAAFMVGALWYGPLFGKQWKVLMGFSDETMKSMSMTMTKAMSGGFVATLILVFVLANFMRALQVFTLDMAFALAFWIWLGFVATIMSNSMWYENRPMKLYIINASHYFVALMVAAAVLAWWPF